MICYKNIVKMLWMQHFLMGKDQVWLVLEWASIECKTLWQLSLLLTHYIIHWFLRRARPNHGRLSKYG